MCQWRRVRVLCAYVAKWLAFIGWLRLGVEGGDGWSSEQHVD